MASAEKVKTEWLRETYHVLGSMGDLLSGGPWLGSWRLKMRVDQLQIAAWEAEGLIGLGEGRKLREEIAEILKPPNYCGIARLNGGDE